MVSMNRWNTHNGEPDSVDFSGTHSPAAMSAAHDALVIGTFFEEMPLDVARVAAAATEQATTLLIEAVGLLLRSAELSDSILRGDGPFEDETEIPRDFQARMTAAHAVECASESARQIAMETFGLLQAPALILEDRSEEMKARIARDQDRAEQGRNRGSAGQQLMRVETRTMPNTTISPEEARRAIYFDFEGLKSEGEEESPLPALLGHECEKTFRCQVLDERLMLMRRGVKRCREGASTIEDAMRELIERCEREGRKLMSFSDHERMICEEWLPEELYGRFEKLWVNAKKQIGWWSRKRPAKHAEIVDRPEEEGGGRTLANYCHMAGLNPSQPPEKGPAETIRFLYRKMAKVRPGRRLDPATRARAKELVRYNQEDCRRLGRLTLKAANLRATLPG